MNSRQKRHCLEEKKTVQNMIILLQLDVFIKRQVLLHDVPTVILESIKKSKSFKKLSKILKIFLISLHSLVEDD